MSLKIGPPNPHKIICQYACRATRPFIKGFLDILSTSPQSVLKLFIITLIAIATSKEARKVHQFVMKQLPKLRLR